MYAGILVSQWQNPSFIQRELLKVVSNYGWISELVSAGQGFHKGMKGVRTLRHLIRRHTSASIMRSLRIPPIIVAGVTPPPPAVFFGGAFRRLPEFWADAGSLPGDFTHLARFARYSRCALLVSLAIFQGPRMRQLAWWMKFSLRSRSISGIWKGKNAEQLPICLESVELLTKPAARVIFICHLWFPSQEPGT
jgi:hypothetical protein